MGGGISVESASLQLTASTIQGNTAGGSYHDGSASGGGLYVSGGSVVASGNDFRANSAMGWNGDTQWSSTWGYTTILQGGQGGSAYGGAICVASGTVKLEDNSISSNAAVGGTGGNADFPPYTGILVGYTLWEGAFSAIDAALVPGVEPPNVVGVTWPGDYLAWGGNGGNGQGGGAAILGGTVTAISNTFSDNQALAGDGGHASGGYLGYYRMGGWDPSSDTYFDETRPVYVVGISPGTSGSSSGADIGGPIQLLQNNSFAVVGGSVVDAMTPLVLNQLTVDKGEAQRSNIESVSVQFNQDTNVQSLIDTGAITSAVQVVGSAGALVLPVDRYHYDASTFTLAIDLTVGHGSNRTMLSDGRYQLQLDTGQITALGSAANHLNMQGTAPALDGQVRYGFFRLLGDLNGDGVVNSQDLVIERNQLIGYAGAVPTPYGDINGDGVVDINDFIALRQRLGRHL
jgi:hypothetical protein